MTKKALRHASPEIHAAFGSSPARAFLLGSSADGESGVVFALENGVARRIDTLQQPCRRIATGHDGTTYGASGTKLLRFDHAGAHEIIPGPRRASELGSIWCGAGLGGKGESLLVAEADECVVHHRVGKRWSRLALPDDASMINSVHAERLEEVFLCAGEGVLCFDGRSTRWVLQNEVGEDNHTFLDDEPSSMAPIGDGSHLVIGDRLHVWTLGERAKRVKSPATDGHCIGVARLGGSIFIASSSGIVRFEKNRATRASDYACIQLMRLGNDALLATGYDGGAAIFDGKSESKIRFA